MAGVLDNHRANALGVNFDAINTAISTALGSVGEIADSPRGAWSFEKQSPVQEMYLRDVEAEGDAVTNVVVESLGRISPTP